MAKNHSPRAAIRLDSPSRPAIRRLFFDIETSPNLVLSWNVGYKLRIDYANIVKERAVICIGYKFAGDKAATVITWDREQSDKSMLAKFIDVLKGADECVGHNIDRFDMPWVKTRCLFHKLPPLPILKTADTLQWARRTLRFNSNRLDYIADFLGVGNKLKTEFGLWKEIVLNRGGAALAKMKQYCACDVALLERVYDRMAIISTIKTHAGVKAGHEKWSCPRCASSNVGPFQRCVTAAGAQQMKMKCRDCGGYYRISDSSRRLHEKAQPPQKDR